MRSKIKTVAVVTGIRSDYHILYPVMKAIDNHLSLSLQVIVTGTHLSPRFGSTWKRIARDFPIAAKIKSLPSQDTLEARAQGLGRQIQGLTKVLGQLKPDITCVLGDREESLAVSASCAYLNLACAHISGGDRGQGTVDDSVRHATSKLAHLHFPTTHENKRRLEALGEETWRIHVVGASGLDRLRDVPSISRDQFLKEIGLEGPFVVILQHPVTCQTPQAASQMQLTLKAIKKSPLDALIIYPNSDAGSQAMIREITNFSRPSTWKVVTTLDDRLWANALKYAEALVGNSSAGLLEAPFMACPAINIGLRQTDRTAGQNLLRVPHKIKDILEALKKAQNPRFRQQLKNKKNRLIYGDGHTGPKIAKILAQTPINDQLLVKRITY